LENIIEDYQKSGLLIRKIKDKTIIDDVSNKISDYFIDSVEHYLSMKKKQFHDFVLGCQEEINCFNIQERLEFNS